MEVVLTRNQFDESNPNCTLQTLGELSIVSMGIEIFKCKTLELPWKDNKRSISCIPTGIYKVTKRTSEKYGNHFHILDVENRSYILIHAGNFVSQLRGCVAVGDNFTYIDQDNLVDVTNSRKTLKTLLDVLPSDFELEII